MPSFNVTTKDGASYTIQAKDEAEAMRALQQLGVTDEAPAIPDWANPATMEGNKEYKDKLAEALQKKADNMAIGESGAVNKGYSFLSNMGNTLELNAPRYLAAGAESLLGKAGVPGFEPDFAKAREQYKAMDEAYSRQNPVSAGLGTTAGIAGQIAAAPAAIGAKPIAAGVEALGASAPVAAAIGRVLGGGALAGGMAATEAGFDTNFDPTAMVKRAAVAAPLGVAGGLVGEGLSKFLASRAGAKAARELAPSADDLTRTANQAYKAADAAGVWYSPKAYQGLVDDIKQMASKGGSDDVLTPNINRAISVLEDAGKIKDTGQNAAVTLTRMDQLRQIVGQAASNAKGNERRLAKTIRDKIDDFVQTAGPKEAIFGDPAAGAEALAAGRAAWTAKSKSRAVMKALDNAELATSRAGSGGNFDNAVRQAASSLYNNEKAMQFFSTEEKEALRKVVEGDVSRNVMRQVSKWFAPTGSVSSFTGGGGVGAAVGTLTANPVIGAAAGAGAMALGHAARKGSDAAARSAMEGVDTLVRTRAVPGASEAIRKAGDPEKQKLARTLMALIGMQAGLGASQFATQR